ncbi:MAG: thermonuclease family protein [Desulfobacula sp.]|jgi:endonuclease YncB( thermonuclease family)
MTNKPLSVFLAIIFLIFFGIDGFSHPGGLDASGGHNDRKNGGYHIHGAPQQQSRRQSATQSPRKTTRQVTTVQTSQGKIQPVTVIGVMDGDTIKVILNGKEEKIRLYGIDSPEKKQAYGQAATAAIKQILTDREINIKIMDVDRYGRSVAIVYADGKSANEIMVKAGYAWVYPQYCKMQVCRDWKGYEGDAKGLKMALWEDTNPEPPWDWRKKDEI